MDNPQHYQPLSHALNPPQPVQPSYGGPASLYDPSPPVPDTRREEEEEEEEEGEEEGLVEEQLNRNDADAASNPSSPLQKSISSSNATSHQPTAAPHQSDTAEPEPKRRPGRPRGSKNRRPRGVPAVGQSIIKTDQAHPASSAASSSQFAYPASTPAVPQHPDINPHNQPYYEFQWRVLNLCAEFYGAAEELVKGTPPLVIAQCYQMGPGNKVDPLAMLTDAKRICDTLLANPAQLITNPPPPPMYTTPTYYSTSYASMSPSTAISTRSVPPVASTSSPGTATTQTPAPSVSPAVPAASASTSKSTTSSTTAPASTVQPSYIVHAPPGTTAYPQYSVYTGHHQYPTTSYYQYGYPTSGPASGYYSHAPAAPPPAPTAVGAAATTNEMTGVGNQGAWSEEETERLKKLAEESRGREANGEIEWDWVVGQWGNTRTRHQILIKATSLGLKESSTRIGKRKRDVESAGGGGGTEAAPPPNTNTTQAQPTTTTAAVHTAAYAAATNSHAPPQTQNHAHTHTRTPPSVHHSLSQGHSHTGTPAASPALQPRSTTAASTTATTTRPAQQQRSPPLQHPQPLQAPTSGQGQGQAPTPGQSKTPAAATATTAALAWSVPMPVVAASTVSPIVASASVGSATAGKAGSGYRDQQSQQQQQQQQATSYYRARPSTGFVHERVNGK